MPHRPTDRPTLFVYPMSPKPSHGAIVDFLSDEILSDENLDRDAVLGDLHCTFGSHVLQSKKGILEKQLDEVMVRANNIEAAIERLDEALDLVSDFGYNWPGTGDFWSSSDRPFYGDDIGVEYMRPCISDFVDVYLKSCTFMARNGQRSQGRCEFGALPSSGRTKSQEDRCQWKRARKMEEREANEAKQHTKQLKREKIEAEIESLKATLNEDE